MINLIDQLITVPLGTTSEEVETEVDIHSVVVLHANTFEVQHSHELGRFLIDLF